MIYSVTSSARLCNTAFRMLHESHCINPMRTLPRVPSTVHKPSALTFSAPGPGIEAEMHLPYSLLPDTLIFSALRGGTAICSTCDLHRSAGKPHLFQSRIYALVGNVMYELSPQAS